MKWTRLLALPLLACVSFLAYIYFSPFVYPYLFKASIPSWVDPFRQTLLPDHKMQIEQPYFWILMGCMLCGYVLASLQIKLSRSYTYGSSRYANRRDTRRFRASRVPSWLISLPLFVLRVPFALTSTAVQAVGGTALHLPFPGRRRGSRFHAGWYQGREIVLSEKDQEEHILITAPTGSGKSTLEILPNLLREQGSRSLFIADLKNELYRLTAGAIARHHQVWWFTPARPEKSHGYNPLAYVKNATDANMLADCWVANTGESKSDPFWERCARFLICAVILHLRAREPYAPFSCVAELITTSTFADLKDLLTNSPSREARRKVKSFLSNLSLNERLIGSVMTEIGNRFQLFDSEAVVAVTSISEIDFDAMIDDPTALYLSIPRSEVEFYRPLMACFTMQMFRAWEQRAADAGTLPRGIACYMDEFANIGHIPNYANFVSTARYLRVALIMVIQNFAQLDERYGQAAAETIRENANTHLLLLGAGLRECRYYSERIGDTTVPTWSRVSKGGGWLGITTDDTWTQSQTRRRLLTPEEIRTMKERTVLLLRAALAPILLKAVPYYKDRRIARLANIPYNVTHIRKQFPAPTQQPGNQSAPQKPPVIIEADEQGQNSKNQDQQHFLADD